MFRFLLFRWGWKLILWYWFLWRVSRLDLQLIPGHSDRAGGLGPLEGVHERFTPLVAALSVIGCASLAESISVGALSATAVYPTLALLLLLDGVLFLAPLLVFTDKLWASRTKGVSAYMTLSARYAKEFEAKWTGGSIPEGEPLLGSADLQSLADLTNAIDEVKSMRWITVGPRLLTMMTLAAAAPLTPLLLFHTRLRNWRRNFSHVWSACDGELFVRGVPWFGVVGARSVRPKDAGLRHRTSLLRNILRIGSRCPGSIRSACSRTLVARYDTLPNGNRPTRLSGSPRFGASSWSVGSMWGKLGHHPNYSHSNTLLTTTAFDHATPLVRWSRAGPANTMRECVRVRARVDLRTIVRSDRALWCGR